MSNRNQEQTNPAGYEFVKSKQQDVIICPDGRKIRIDVERAINSLFENSGQTPFEEYLKLVGDVHGIMLDADMPKYLSVRVYQEHLKSLEVVNLFLRNLFIREDKNE